MISFGDHATTLRWGHRYLAVRPEHFRVDYEINPFMDVSVQPDPELTLRQWDAMIAAIRAAGAEVDVLEQRPDAPDMVYAMNLALGVEIPDGAGVRRHAVMSHMRFPQRRMEGMSAQPWLASNGFTTSYVGRDGVGAHFEAGDAFAWRGDLVVGYGPRTDELGLKHLAADLGVRVRGLRITHPGMYHLDLAFCPLDSERALVCPAALDDESAAALLALVPEPIVLTEDEALSSFVANSVVVGRTIIAPAMPDRVREQVEAWGFEVVLVEVSELHKGGGSVRCMTNPVDIRIGRDLVAVDGGEVILPSGG